MTATIHQGDCRETLKTLPDQSVHCCVTSPPYFGLRDYGHDGQIGLEQTPDAYVAKLVDVFREVRRVLRDDGTLWLNIGDSYAAQGGAQVQGTKQAKGSQSGAWNGETRKPPQGIKPKDLTGIPWMLAFALRADGWWLRQDIIWHKPNPMPESVTDRCTKAHEYLFLLTKSAKYYFDNEAIKEDAKWSSDKRAGEGRLTYDGKRQGQDGTGQEAFVSIVDKRNRRSVWTIPTKPFRGAHFATFPSDLIEPCILAGCPRNGTVLDPFNGSGTTGMVSLENGRNYIGIELNPEYIKLTNERLKVTQPTMF